MKSQSKLRSLMARIPGLVFPVIVVTLSALAAVSIQHSANSVLVDIMVDMEVSDGTSAEVYVNESYDSPYTTSLQPTKRVVYLFKGVPGTVNTLRFDPTNVSRATFRIYRIAILRNGIEERRFEAKDIGLWTLGNIALKTSGTEVYFESTSNDPIIVGRPNYSSPTTLFAPPLLASPLGNATSPNLFFLLLVVALVFTMFAPTTRCYLVLTAVCYGLLLTVITAVLKRQTLPLSARVAVGASGWMGDNKAAVTTAVWVGFFTAVALAVVFYFLARRVSKIEWAAPPTDQSKKSFRWANWVVLIGLAALFIPDLTYSAQSLVAPYHSQWDFDNLTAWRYMAASGLTAYKDFWYPYGFLGTLSGKFPWPEVIQYLNIVLVTFELFVGLFQCVGRRLGFPLLGLMVIVAGHFSGLFPNMERYLLAVNIVLFYAAFKAGQPRNWKTEILFAAVTAHAIVADPSQAVYAAPAILLSNVVDYFTNKTGNWRMAVRDLLAGFRYVFLFAVLFCGYLTFTGQLASAFRIYSNLGDMSTYSSVPVALESWLTATNSSALITVNLCLVSLGIFVRLSAQDSHSALPSMLLLTSLTTFVGIQKMLVRPYSMAEQLMPMAAVTILIFLYICYVRPWRVLHIPLYVSVGTLIATFAYNGTFTSMVERLKLSVPTTLRNVSLLTNSGSIDSTNLSQFASERFNLDAALYEVARVLGPDLGKDRRSSVFVLGDNAILYILLGIAPPYHVNLYNASPIYEQQILTAWIDKTKPKYVVWDTEAKAFDGVPNVVRTPLIYEKVVDDFVPYKTVGRYEVLRRRQTNESIDLAFWRSRLGETVDIGHLGEVSSAPELKECQSTTKCMRFLEISAPNADGEHIEVPFRSGSLDFVVKFARISGQAKYAVALDRIWFWHASVQERGAPEIQPLPPGTEAQVVSKEFDPEVLY